jgi:hypothetical protein
MQLVAVNSYFVFVQLFFVLRKKNDQITNLHVIHHGLIPVVLWFGLKFVAGTVTYLHFACEWTWVMLKHVWCVVMFTSPGAISVCI